MRPDDPRVTNRRSALRHSDLRGAVRLATDAAAGLADLVEAVHARVTRIPGLGAPNPDGRLGGISGLVYRSVRGVTRLAGGSVDALLGLLAPALETEEDPGIERASILAALNGVLGDYLAETANPLATPMALRRDGRPLTLEAAALKACLPDAGPQLLVLLHGLCMSDRQWLRDGHDHGRALARDLGFSPVYLQYNSGLHISINGRALAQALERLVDAWPDPVGRLVLLGHSMGGLVARSAVHYGGIAGHRWPGHLRELVFLGTPHHGSPLERAGHWVDIVLGATPYASPFARLGKVRSAGITDLRHGNLVDEDWMGRDRFARGPDRRQHLPLPAGVHSFAIAATLGEHPPGAKGRLAGDGLVPVASALGRHPDPARSLAFDADRQWVGTGMNHLELLNRAEVYGRIRQWLE